jgi:hypothetical protein
MGLFSRNKPNDVLFLMPVRLGGEKLPRSKIRMLYCDVAGKVYASIISRAVYELAADSAERMKSRHRPFAVLGLESSPGEFVPAAVEIDAGEVWALEHILEHALKSGRLPDILKKYLKPIIKMGEASREEVLLEHKRNRRQARLETMPSVLGRLSYYAEDDIEVSMPIYKAEHSYPLVVLKSLPPDEDTPDNMQRLLVLDSDGDLAVIKVPAKLMDSVEKGLKEHRRGNGGDVHIVISKQAEGLSINYMAVTKAQERALDTIARYYEETGSGKQPISAAATAVLTRARNSISLLAK